MKAFYLYNKKIKKPLILIRLIFNFYFAIIRKLECKFIIFLNYLEIKDFILKK